jgi:hypothetical protein
VNNFWTKDIQLSGIGATFPHTLQLRPQVIGKGCVTFGNTPVRLALYSRCSAFSL